MMAPGAEPCLTGLMHADQPAEHERVLDADAAAFLGAASAQGREPKGLDLPLRDISRPGLAGKLGPYPMKISVHGPCSLLDMTHASVTLGEWDPSVAISPLSGYQTRKVGP